MSASNLLRICSKTTLSSLNQGASLSIRARVPATVAIRSGWREDGRADLRQIFYKDSVPKKVKMKVNEQEEKLTSIGRLEPHVKIDLDNCHQGLALSDLKDSFPVDRKEGDEETLAKPGTILDLVVPEKVNLSCDLQNGGSIHISGKIEGDIHLSTSDGDICVAKLRGHSISLKSGGDNSLIYARDSLEAQQLNVETSGRIRVKQIHGNDMKLLVSTTGDGESRDVVESDDGGSLVDISSAYVSGGGEAYVSVVSKDGVHPSRNAIRVKSNHGAIRIDTRNLGRPSGTSEFTGATFPLVELGGVNGSCEVMMENTSYNDDEWTSCLVHFDSLSPDSVSLVSVDIGDIGMTLDRKVEADLRLLSTSNSECLVEAGALLAEEENLELVQKVIDNIPPGTMPSPTQRISIETKAFTPRPNTVLSKNDIEYMDGWIENKSEEPDSRFDRKSQGGSSSGGKVRLESAADQALYGFARSEDSKPAEERPLVAAVGTGQISLESVSWLGAIARRYGLEENERDLGRTASRSGRAFVPPQKE